MKDAGIKNAAVFSDVQMKMIFVRYGGNTGVDIFAVPSTEKLHVFC